MRYTPRGSRPRDWDDAGLLGKEIANSRLRKEPHRWIACRLFSSYISSMLAKCSQKLARFSDGIESIKWKGVIILKKIQNPSFPPSNTRKNDFGSHTAPQASGRTTAPRRASRVWPPAQVFRGRQDCEALGKRFSRPSLVWPP